MFRYSVLFVILFSLGAQAEVGINWSDAVTIVDIDSSGDSLTSEFIFELGAFEASFDEQDPSTWADAWVALDRTRYRPAAQLATFQTSSVLMSNSAPFQAGGQVYILGYRPSGPVNEWFLVRNPVWTWPFANPVGPPPFQRNYTLSQSGLEVIAGSVSGNQFQTDAINEVTPPLSWPQWQQLSFTTEELADPQVSGIAADPDGDGLSNGFEYFIGGDPLVASPSHLNLILDPLGRETLAVARSSSADLEAILMESTDLTDWRVAEEHFIRFEEEPNLLRWTRNPTSSPTPAPSRFFQIQLSAP